MRCEYKTASKGYRCHNIARHGIQVSGREEEIKYFCSAHFSTVVWTLKQIGESFKIIGD